MALRQAALHGWRELEAFMKTMGCQTEHPSNNWSFFITHILTGNLVICFGFTSMMGLVSYVLTKP